MTHLIEAQNVVKTFGDTHAADHISLNIPAGSIYGLLGPNGAGKTTFIRMVTTITKPDSGSILFKGHELHSSDAARMGYMPEERGLYKKMSVLDQLLFFAEIKGIPANIAREKAKIWLKRMEMGTWANKKLEELSKGMAQKVQFLCTIIHDPEFIILDEPFSGFDPVNADLIKDLIIELNQNGATILFSTHRMDNVEELCNHLCIIHRGKVVLDGDSGTLRRRMFDNTYETGFLNPKNFDNSSQQPIKSTQTPDGRYIYTFQTSAEFTPEQLLEKSAALGDLVHFSENLPTIHSIFVNTVKNPTP